MKAEIAKTFVLYTVSMFKDMFNFTPVYKKAYIIKDLQDHKWDISAAVGIIGSIEGVVAIRMKRSLAFKLLNESNMVGDCSDEIIEMISGMISEFANIICGNSINRLYDSSKINVTVPFTIQGTNHTITWPTDGDIIAIPFDTPLGGFELQLSLTS